MEIGYILEEHDVEDLGIILEDSKPIGTVPADHDHSETAKPIYHEPPTRTFGFTGENFFRLPHRTRLRIREIYQAAGVHQGHYLEFPKGERTGLRGSRKIHGRPAHVPRIDEELQLEDPDEKYFENFDDTYGPATGNYMLVEGVFSFRPESYRAEILSQQETPRFNGVETLVEEDEERDETLDDVIQTFALPIERGLNNLPINRNRVGRLKAGQLDQWSYESGVISAKSDGRVSLSSLPSKIRRVGESLPTGYEGTQFHEDLVAKGYDA